jgi:hypothetical protein
MITDAQKHAWLYNLNNLPVRRWPFDHCLLDHTIPPDLYAQMQQHMPPHEEFVPLHSTGRIGKGAYPERFIYDPNAMHLLEWSSTGQDSSKDPNPRMFLWDDLRVFLLSREFALSLAAPYGKLAAQLRQNPDAWIMDTLLIEDLPGYRIGPHADAPHKVLSALFYLGRPPVLRIAGAGMLPGPKFPEWGTSLYQPNDSADVDPQSGRHYEFADFTRIATVPYAYNAGLSFLKSNKSWHGVETIPAIEGERRIVLLADIKVRR